MLSQATLCMGKSWCMANSHLVICGRSCIYDYCGHYWAFLLKNHFWRHLSDSRMFGQRTVDQGRLVIRRLIKRMVHRWTIGLTPLQWRNKHETLWNIFNFPPSQISLDPRNVFINRWCCIMFMRPSLREKHWDYNVYQQFPNFLGCGPFCC